MNLIAWVIDAFAPIFLIISPLTSYSDQIWSIHKTRSSAGFSLDIPLIMLFASIVKVFYWFGARYSPSLLVQAMIMIAVQLVLLKVALDNRPPMGVRDGVEHAPFSGVNGDGPMAFKRPYRFWQWRNAKPYWTFILYLTLSLLAVQLLLPPLANSQYYTSFLGYAGLSVEAILPIPQILKNQHARSCKGFRFSVLASWILGDIMKMSYFFFSSESIPWAFRLCGIFQFGCDAFLGVQYWMYGAGEEAGSMQKEKSYPLDHARAQDEKWMPRRA